MKNLILITDHFQGLIVELREKLASHEDDKDVDFSVDIWIDQSISEKKENKNKEKTKKNWRNFWILEKIVWIQL